MAKELKPIHPKKIILHCSKCYETQFLSSAKKKKLEHSVRLHCKKCGNTNFRIHVYGKEMYI